MTFPQKLKYFNWMNVNNICGLTSPMYSTDWLNIYSLGWAWIDFTTITEILFVL